VREPRAAHIQVAPVAARRHIQQAEADRQRRVVHRPEHPGKPGPDQAVAERSVEEPVVAVRPGGRITRHSVEVGPESESRGLVPVLERQPVAVGCCR
jgi:hypothetical protein